MKISSPSLLHRLFADLSWIDFRAMAACRILLGVTLLFDLFSRSFLITTFYTDSGLYPRHLVSGPLFFQFHAFSGEAWCQFLILGVSILLAASFTLGVFPRMSALLLWAILTSMHQRNYMLIHLGDVLGRTLLFWSVFLPFGQKWALGKKAPEIGAPKGEASLASFAILLQVLVVYLATALLKKSPTWHTDFTAIFYSLHLDEYTSSLGRLLLPLEGLLKALTAFTFYLELLGPALLLAAGLQQVVRWVVPTLFVGLHVGIMLTMHIGIFPWVCVCGWILFLPSGFWNLAERRFQWMRLPTWPGMPWPQLSPNFLPRPWIRIGSHLIILYFLLGAIAWSGHAVVYSLPKPLVSLFGPLRNLGFSNQWKMYAPAPPLTDGWLVFEGRTIEGDAVDAWRGDGKPAWEKPSDVYEYTGGLYWRNYFALTFVYGDASEERRQRFAHFLCERWPHKSAPLATIKIYQAVESSPPNPHLRSRALPKGEFTCPAPGA